VIQGYTNTGIHEYRNTKFLEYKVTRIQGTGYNIHNTGYRDKRDKRCMIQGCRIHRSTGLQG